MENKERAKQFMPFASLRGYYSLVLEKARLKEAKKELSEDECEKISCQLNQITKGMMIKVKYYNKDSYTEQEGLVSKIDKDFQKICIVKTEINFNDILNIEIMSE